MAESYDLAYVCWAIAGLNFLGFLYFLFFAKNVYKKSSNTNSSLLSDQQQSARRRCCCAQLWDDFCLALKETWKRKMLLIIIFTVVGQSIL